MKSKTLIHNARIHTQADGLVVDSMAICKNRIVAVGNNLKYDSDFKSYDKIDMKGKTVIPGLVDAHTHFYFFALTFNRVSLRGLDSVDACLRKIKTYASTLKKTDWVVGEGYTLDQYADGVEPDRFLLDKVTGGRPAFLFSRDEHSVWVNSRALELAGITNTTPQPAGGEIVKSEDGTPTGILREIPGYGKIYALIPQPSKRIIDQCYRRALDYAYSKGVTGIHSFDSADAFSYLSELAERGKVGLRINYYPPAGMLSQLRRNRVRYGMGTDFLRIAGVKIFADGSLGSQSAYCFNKYQGGANGYGIEVTPIKEIRRLIKSAARLGLPSATHAIGDRAVANVIEALQSAPPLRHGARHRIEHLQLLRRKDIPHLKRLGVVASMQPSHCPSDIEMIHKYWGVRGRNAFIFRTLLDNGINLAFGSDVPIEPLDPLAGIAAAVTRAKPGHRGRFYPEQRLTAAEALYNFTVGPAVASGQEHCRGYLLPGYPVDFVVLSDDITRIATSRICDVKVLATILDGRVKYCRGRFNL